jgi:hypothetical protein
MPHGRRGSTGAHGIQDAGARYREYRCIDARGQIVDGVEARATADLVALRIDQMDLPRVSHTLEIG